MIALRIYLTQLFIIWLVTGVAQQGQVCLSFRDKTNGKYGFKEKESGKIIIPAEYEKVSCSFGELFPVFKDGYWFVLNASNQSITPMNKMKDQILYHQGRFDSEPKLYGLTTHFNTLLNEFGAVYYQYYRINDNCDCIPEDGMLCPFFVDIDTTNTPTYLKFLQQSYVAATRDFDANKVYLHWKEAREAAPDNAFVDYFLATLMYNDFEFDNYFPNYNSKKYIELFRVVDSLENDKSSEKDRMEKLVLLQWHRSNLDDYKKWAMKDYFSNYAKSDSSDKYYDLALSKEKNANGETPFYWQISGARFKAYGDELSRKENKEEFKILRSSQYKKEYGGTIGDVTVGVKGFTQNGYTGWGVAAQFSVMNLSFFANSLHYGIGYDRFMKETSTVNAVNLDFHAINLNYFFGDMGRSFGVRPTLPLSFWRIQLEYGYQFMFGSNNRDLRGHHLGVKWSIPIYNLFRYVNDFYYFNSTFNL
jgi:hypothetical protein